MKREITWGMAAALALAAAVGISTQPARKTTQASIPEKTRGKVTRHRAQNKSKLQAGNGCSDIEEIFRAFLLTQKNSFSAPTVCYSPGVAPPPNPDSDLVAKASNLKFVIATLPDPLHTHFSLLFDREAEAIQQAAQDEGYVYDSSWLPWETEEQSFDHLIDEDLADERREAREDQPGVILFRKPPTLELAGNARQDFRDGLVIFIVGEEATRGIHRWQFVNAAAWIAALYPPEKHQSTPVKILGPSFSGSFPSMEELLSDDSIHKFLNYRTPASKPEGTKLRLHSGSITSQSAAGRFVKTTQSDPNLQGWGISFHSFQESDSNALSSYCNYLKRLGTDMKRVVVISEDETAYGSSESDSKACQESTQLNYPRDISALRAAYQTQSIFSSGTAQSTAEMQRRNLTSDLADPADEAHDTIRSYGGNQDPLSQEAVLLGIVGVLRAQHAEYLLLRSSNTLDPLFLSNFLRRAYPEGRVVIVGSDLLYQRERGSTGISGVLMLTTYPLFPRGPDWTKWPTPFKGTSHRVFGEDLVEGLYIATRFLLHDSAVLGDTPNETSGTAAFTQSPDSYFVPLNLRPDAFNIPIPDYAAPFWTVPSECKGGEATSLCKSYLRPSMWLSVLGRGDFFPVATFNREAKMAPAIAVPSEEKTAMPFAFKLCLFLVAGLACFHLVCCWQASFTAKPAFRAHFASVRGTDRLGRRRHPFLIVAISLVIAFMALVLGWSSGFFSGGNGLLSAPCVICMFLVFVGFATGVSIIASHVATRRMARNKFEGGKGSSRPGAWCKWSRRSGAWLWKRIASSSILYVLLLVLLGLVFVAPLERSLGLENRFSAYFRDMDLTSGVSPAVPFLLLALGLYTWLWCSLHGLALFGPDRPRLPLLANLKLPDARAEKYDLLHMFSRERGNLTEAVAIPCEKYTAYIAIVLFCLFAALASAMASLIPLRSLGPRSYALLYCVLLDTCISLLLAEACQLCRMWSRLKELLVFLDRLPIRRTLEALRGFSWGSVWKMSGNVLEVRYKLISRQIESLNHVNSTLHKFPPIYPSASLSRALLSMEDMRVAMEIFAAWYAQQYRDSNAGSLRELQSFQKSIARLAGTLLANILIPAWRKQTGSLVLQGPDATSATEHPESASKRTLPAAREYIANVEELVCLTYLGFVQNILGRMRTSVLGMVWLFVSVTLSLSSYPFDPRPGLTGILIVLFVVLAGVISFVYADMHRDATLSRVTNTNPGELGGDFWLKLIGVGVGPLFGLLTVVFPGLADFLFSWLEPGLAALK